MARKQKRFHRVRRQERWALTCERVFTVLTSGPFPTGSPEDDLIDAHLSFCPDCRRLAEALRPTRDMLVESDEHPKASDGDSPAAEMLPGYWWTTARRMSALDELEFAAGSRADANAARRFDWRGALAIAVGVAVTTGVLIGLYQVGCLIDAAKRF